MNKHGNILFEKILLFIILGLSKAIKEKCITINESEKILFSPLVMKRIKELNVSEDLVDLIHLGTELENIERLLPDKLFDNIEEIVDGSIKHLKDLPEQLIESDVVVESISKIFNY